MVFYLLIFIIVSIGFLFDLYNKKQKKHKIVFWIVLLLVAIIVGVRDMIGGYDIYIYSWYFETIPLLENLSKLYFFDPLLFGFFEPGYLLINSIIKTIYNDKYFFFFLIAILTYIIIGKSFCNYRYSIFVFFLFFAKFFIVSFVYTRQFIAMGLIWWGINFLMNNKKMIFILLFVLAVSVHYSAFVVLPIYFINKKRFSNKILLIIFLISLILGVTPFIKILMGYIDSFAGISKLDNYATAEQSGFHIPYFLETTLLAFCVLKCSHILYRNKQGAILLNILVFYIIFSYLTLRDTGVVRFIWYFFLGYAVLVPFFFAKLIKDKVIISLIVLSYFGFVYFRNVTVRDGGNFIPYKAFFMDTKRVDKFGN